MTTPIDTLIAICRNATQGEWEFDHENWLFDGPSANSKHWIISPNNDETLEVRENDKHFITTFQPKTVERMLELLKLLSDSMIQYKLNVDEEPPYPYQDALNQANTFLSTLSKEATE